jgi:hypothetical protein
MSRSTKEIQVMPLITSKSPTAFKKNVETEIKAGKPQKQALAIAYAKKNEAKDALHVGDTLKAAKNALATRRYGAAIDLANDVLNAAPGSADARDAKIIVVEAKRRMAKDALPLPIEVKRQKLAAYNAGLTEAQDFDRPNSLNSKAEQMIPGTKVHNAYGEVGFVVRVEGSRVEVRTPDGPDQWDLAKTWITERAFDVLPIKVDGEDSLRTDEDAYFKRRRELQAEFDKKNPNDDTNKLRAHEQALRERGEKVTPYRVAEDAEVDAMQLRPGQKFTYKGKSYIVRDVGSANGGIQIRTKSGEKIFAPNAAIKFEVESAKDCSPEETLAEARQAKDTDIDAEIQAAWEEKKARIKSLAESAGLNSEKLAALPGLFAQAWRYAYKSRYVPRACTARAEIAVKQSINANKASSKLSFDSSPEETLAEARQAEVAQDHARALDAYRQAASGFRKVGDSRNEQTARDGIAACQRQAAGGYSDQYMHPSRGKAQAFDSAERALESAVERTRSGEDVELVPDDGRPDDGDLMVRPCEDEHEGFAKLEHSLAHRKGITNPDALAAAIGRKKYGVAGMAAKSAAGRAKDSRDPKAWALVAKIKALVPKMKREAAKPNGNTMRIYEEAKRLKSDVGDLYDEEAWYAAKEALYDVNAASAHDALPLPVKVTRNA